jgi:hypothetical protein
LLFANCGSACGNGNLNYVYVAFSMMDGVGYPYPNGAIIAYDSATLSPSTLFYFQASDGHDEQDSNGGGIWQGGAALAFGSADSSGKNCICVATANGTFDLNTGGTNAGDSLLKLDPDHLVLTANSSGYFTPSDQFYRSDQSCSPGGDVDFGPGGPMLIPDN